MEVSLFGKPIYSIYNGSFFVW